MALITWEHVVTHLRLEGVESDHQAAVLPKMEQATAIVLQRISAYLARVEPEWTAETDPDTDPDFAIVQAVILDTLAHLYQFRGDSDKTPVGPLTENGERALRGLIDPAFA